MKIKITVNDYSNTTKDIVKAETIFDTAEDRFETNLGVAIYDIECLGFPFVITDVYNEAIAKYQDVRDILKSNKYTTIYKSETPKMIISILK